MNGRRAKGIRRAMREYVWDSPEQYRRSYRNVKRGYRAGEANRSRGVVTYDINDTERQGDLLGQQLGPHALLYFERAQAAMLARVRKHRGEGNKYTPHQGEKEKNRRLHGYAR